MRRRTVLAAAAGLGGGLAGCIGQSPADADGDPTPTDSSSPTDSATPSPTPTPSPESRVTGTEFTVTDRSCGTGESTATVTSTDATVAVDGTARGSNGCYTAGLESAAFDGGELRVAIRTREEGGTDTACTQCIVDIDYEATVEYEGRLDGVVVTHDGEVVADRDY